ncbi:MAG: hypothetical protein JO227_04160 [Acetobacteraceae bacterium]|nr:hypothetical protein [Acetobacteraceae bacterium]
MSYRNLLETEEYRQPLSNLDWNLFRHTDLPQLAAKAAPRTVHLAGAVDARGEKMDVSAVRRIYASDNMRISPEPAWDEQALSAL